MCCEKCTSDGIYTPLGRKIFNEAEADERIKLAETCPKMDEIRPAQRYGKHRVMWGICRASSDRRVVECCRHCDNFL